MKHIIFITVSLVSFLLLVSCSPDKKISTASSELQKTRNVEDDYVAETDDNFITPDLAFFNLKGNVKGIKIIFTEANFNGIKFISKEKNLVFGNNFTETFDKEGKWKFAKDIKIKRNVEGYIISIDSNDPEANPVYNSIIWKNGKMQESLQDYDTKHFYHYNKDDILTEEIISRGGDFPYKTETRYSYSIFDEHGNWTKRCEKHICSPTDITYWITYRKIYYYTKKK